MKWNVLGLSVWFFLLVAAIILYWLAPETKVTDLLVTIMLSIDALVVMVKFLKLKV